MEFCYGLDSDEVARELKKLDQEEQKKLEANH
jgi:hypothetical protein